jgi:predicted small integral membrane protein
VTSVRSSRLAWIDWMRGLACVLMFQTHCYDAWLGGDARNGRFLNASQRLGTLPAPLFLFLAGISFALVADKLMRKGQTPTEITRTMARHGAEILAFGLLFRLQEFLIAWGWAPWSDLLRVDVLNIIGLSMILMALLCGMVLYVWGRAPTPVQAERSSASVGGDDRSGFAIAVAAIAAAALIALLTPPLYTTWRPTWLPWPLESYIDGCHNLGAPQPWLFPLFPWAAFAFAGLAAGFILFSDVSIDVSIKDRAINDQAIKVQARNQMAKPLALFAVVGAIAILAARQLDHSSFHLYSTYDYWHTSPNFLMMRVGMLLVIAFLSYAWCRWGLGARGFSPLIQLGQTSLLVYWVHIEFVYGRFSLLPKRAESIPTASRGLLEICLFMLILSLLRTKIDWKGIDWKKMIRRVQPA